ncbi:MAG: HNH endonuclease [Bacteroidota bacterium]|nr:HNH endonuclease [Bacteroidota bacterium]
MIEYFEGKEKLITHKSKERNKELVEQAKKSRLQTDPLLHCDICNIFFIVIYSDMVNGYMDSLYITPISRIAEETLVITSDLVLICSNCHRMLHRVRPWLTIEQLKKSIKKVVV